MPYSNRYIMQQMARGRPAPQGSPEPALHRALACVSPMDIEDAFRMGARCDTLDPRGRSSVHILLDHALSPAGQLNADPHRLLACLRALVRNGASWNACHPQTRQSAISRMLPLAALPVGPQVRELLSRQVRWNDRVEVGGETLREAWDRQSTPPSSRPRPR